MTDPNDPVHHTAGLQAVTPGPNITPSHMDRISHDNGSDDSKPRHELEQNQRRTYPPTHKEGDAEAELLSLDRAVKKEPMWYGAIMQFQVIARERMPDIIYGLGVDGGVYAWDRARKSWALVNK